MTQPYVCMYSMYYNIVVILQYKIAVHVVQQGSLDQTSEPRVIFPDLFLLFGSFFFLVVFFDQFSFLDDPTGTRDWYNNKQQTTNKTQHNKQKTKN